MISSFFNSSFFKLGGISVWVVLTIGGLIAYTGSSLIYISFSLIFLFLLVDGLYRQLSLSYAFLVVFLWLGFWLKLITHLWLKYPYLEPIGYFDGLPETWDAVLAVGMAGAAGVILTKILFSKYAKKYGRDKPEINNYVPSWYLFARPWLWTITWLFVFTLPTINFLWGIAQVGLVPSLVLPWPMNGLIAWFLGFGLVALISTLTYWDGKLGLSWKIGLTGILAEGFLGSLSTLSRAMYLFHTLPYLIVLFVKHFSTTLVRKKIKMTIVYVWLFLLTLSLVFVMLLRYSNISFIDASSNNSLDINENFSSVILIGKLTKKVSSLIVDRWIGLEGVMAVVSYPEKSKELFTTALQERRVKGRVDLYTEKIARVNVEDLQVENFQYATIPGGVAFFYYTGSLLFVFVGMACLTFLMIISEKVVFFLTRNPYLCAFWAMGIAQWVASFGLGTVQMLTYYAVCFAAMIFIWIVQTISPVAKSSG